MKIKIDMIGKKFEKLTVMERAPNGKTLQEWSEELGIKYTTLWNRIFTYDWPLEKALRKE